jgi:hypothetical protein
MWWIHTALEVGLVAGITIGRSATVAIRMALRTIHSYVLTCEGEGCVIMIEDRSIPLVHIMTDYTVGRQLGIGMIRVGGAIEVILMAGEAIGRSADIAILVALHTIDSHVAAR